MRLAVTRGKEAEGSRENTLHESRRLVTFILPYDPTTLPHHFHHSFLLVLPAAAPCHRRPAPNPRGRQNHSAGPRSLRRLQASRLRRSPPHPRPCARLPAAPSSRAFTEAGTRIISVLLGSCLRLRISISSSSRPDP